MVAAWQLWRLVRPGQAPETWLPDPARRNTRWVLVGAAIGLGAPLLILGAVRLFYRQRGRPENPGRRQLLRMVIIIIK